MTGPHVTTTEAAAILGLSDRRIRALIASGRLRAVPGLQGYVIRRSALDRFAQQPRKPGRPRKKRKTP